MIIFAKRWESKQDRNSSIVLELVSESEDETRRIGERLGQFLEAGDVLLLEGNFGAGKTVMVQGIAKGLGSEDRVTSPSFTLVNEYKAALARGSTPIYHADLYRIESVDEALALGIEEYLDGRGIFIVEWPEKARDIWPAERLWVYLDVEDENKRVIRFDAKGERYVKLITELAGSLGINEGR